jgi:hypothetical protein
MWPSSFCFLTFEIKIFLCLGELGKRHSMRYLFVWVHTRNTRSHQPLQLSQIHRLNKLLISLQSESLLFIRQTVQNQPNAYFLFSKIFK